MGTRYRKSIKAGPFRINFSKSGIGWSVGAKGFRYTQRADGRTQETFSIPGTGVSYVRTEKASTDQAPDTQPAKQQRNKRLERLDRLEAFVKLAIFISLCVLAYAFITNM